MSMENIRREGVLGITGEFSACDDADLLLKGNGHEFIFNKDSRTLVMGILNVTPDSFSDGGLFTSKQRAVAHALGMVEDGADIIDIGGESTRPGAKVVSPDDEAARIIPLVKELAGKGIVISVDTSKALVARMALDAGAWMINDVSAMRDPAMSGVLNEFNAPVVLMHMRGNPRTMQDSLDYDDITGEILAYLAERIDFASSRGLKSEQIVIDPGIGFGKSKEGNFTIIKELKRFKALGRPLLVGASRKSFLSAEPAAPQSGEQPEKLAPTIAAHSAAILNGADIIRVHDVKEGASAARIVDFVRDMN
jgi:dihydropteroate synthase